MTLPTIIRDRTNDGITVVDFLIEVMQDERDGFKICHRLDAAKLLTKYGCACKSPVAERDEAIDFILDNPPEPSRRRAGSGASNESEFDTALAKVIRESTDDGRSVCRFLINVMDGELKAFKPHHRIAAARELLNRGFGKGAREENRALRSATVRTPEAHGSDRPSRSSYSPDEAPTAVAIAEADPDAHQQTEDDDGWAAFWEEMAPIIERDDRHKAELAEQEIDPDNPPHVPDLSAFHEAWENTQKLYEEWKRSFSDPSELEAILHQEAARFDAMVDRKVERRRQIDEDRERRAKEEAEREAEQAKARAEAKVRAESAAAEEPDDPGPPPTREEHEYISYTPNIPTSYFYKKCGHPKCTVCDKPRYYPEDDRSSRYYFDGRAPPMYGSYGL